LDADCSARGRAFHLQRQKKRRVIDAPENLLVRADQRDGRGKEPLGGTGHFGRLQFALVADAPALLALEKADSA
jgi:hypothetical protein